MNEQNNLFLPNGYHYKPLPNGYHYKPVKKFPLYFFGIFSHKKGVQTSGIVIFGCLRVSLGLNSCNVFTKKCVQTICLVK